MHPLIYIAVVLLVGGFLVIDQDNIRDLLYKRAGRVFSPPKSSKLGVYIILESGVKHRVKTIEILSDDVWRLEMEPVKPPFVEEKQEISRSMLKHDPFHTIRSGEVVYQVRGEAGRKSRQPQREEIPYTHPAALNPENGHPFMTTTDVEESLELKTRKILQLESELSEVRANGRQDVEDALRQIGEIGSSGHGFSRRGDR